MDYAKVAARASAVLAKNGEPVTLRRPKRLTTDYDPDLGAVSNPGGVTETPCFMVTTKMYRGAIANSTIDANDLSVLLSLNSAQLRPAPRDQVIRSNGDVYGVVAAEVLAPGAIEILYTAQLRKSAAAL